MNLKLIAISLMVYAMTFFSDKPAYQIFDAKGKDLKYSKMIEKLSDADIVLFGELHTNPICHWLEYEILKDLHQLKKEKMIVGAEMFEADNQLILSEFLSNKFDSKKFEDEVKLWKNYTTDYKPLVEYCKTNAISFIATNVPRRYASMVNKGGFEVLDSLSVEAKANFADLPVKYDPELKCYKDMLEMSKEMGGHASPNFPKAQAIKDATMAKFILKNWLTGKLFLHIEGSYHSDNYQGIVWYLLDKNPNLKIVTISSVEQKDLENMEGQYKNRADFIITIPESMTQTSK